jgi:hypothetical protein
MTSPHEISTEKENGLPAACAAQQPEQKQKTNYYRTASFSFFNARTLTLTVAGLAANH